MVSDPQGAADLSAVFAAHGVAVAYLFGSQAEGTAGPASDHDIPDPYRRRHLVPSLHL
jgi:hypothetical protein